MILQRDKIGFALSNLGPSQLSYSLLKEAADNRELDSVFFYETVDRSPINPTTATMHIAELYSYDGPVIATNLTTAIKLAKSPSPKPKYFYVWDLEWLRLTRKSYHVLYNIYGNPDFTLITRCEDYRKLIENAWNKKVEFIIDNGKFLSNEAFLNHAKKNSSFIYSAR